MSTVAIAKVGLWGLILMIALSLESNAAVSTTTQPYFLKQKVLDPGYDPDLGGGGFGDAVTMSKDGFSAAVGAPTRDDQRGAVYTLIRDFTTSRWSTGSLLIPSDSTTPDGGFGASVSMSADGSVLAASAPGEDGNGAFWVFRRTSSNSATWTQAGKKVNLTHLTGRSFADTLSVSRDGKTIAATCLRKPNDGPILAIFDEGPLNQWNSTLLTPSDTDSDFVNPRSIDFSLDGARVAVGAPYTFSSVGAVWMVLRNSSGAWNLDVGGYYQSPNVINFGMSVSFHHNSSLLLIAGSEGLTVWRFNPQTGRYVEIQSIERPDGSSTGFSFNPKWALFTGNRVVVGDYTTNNLPEIGLGGYMGAIYVYELSALDQLELVPGNLSLLGAPPGVLEAGQELAIRLPSAIAGNDDGTEILFGTTRDNSLWIASDAPPTHAPTPATTVSPTTSASNILNGVRTLLGIVILVLFNLFL